jgi:hypothetical protein
MDVHPSNPVTHGDLSEEAMFFLDAKMLNCVRIEAPAACIDNEYAIVPRW